MRSQWLRGLFEVGTGLARNCVVLGSHRQEVLWLPWLSMKGSCARAWGTVGKLTVRGQQDGG